MNNNKHKTLTITFMKEKTKNLICNNCRKNINQLIRFKNKENKVKFCFNCLNLLTKVANSYQVILKNKNNKPIKLKTKAF